MAKKPATDGPLLPTLSWNGVVGRRLARQGLNARLGDGVAEVASAMLGAHAQVMSAAEWSIGLRHESATRADIRAALWEQHSLIKTYGPRGTVHLLPASELATWTGALAAVPPVSNPFPAPVRLSPQQIDEVVEAIGASLADAELTLSELGEAIVARTGAWAGELAMEAFQSKWPRWRLAERAAANRGVLVFGPNRGRNITYTSPRRRLPSFKPLPGERAVRQLALAYVRGYGPVTAQHFAQWLSAPAAWAVALFGRLAGEIEEVDAEGARGFVAAGDRDEAEPGDSLRLLPYFDAYAIASHPRARVFGARGSERALNRGQAGNFPILLIDGHVAGVWSQQRSGKRLVVTVEAFEELGARQRKGLDAEVARLGQFFGEEASWSAGTVTTGGHA